MRTSIRLALAALIAAALPAQKSDYSQSLAPYVPSPQPVITRMLEAARLKPGEVVYDLGCGDGRILVTAVQKFGARAVGVELSPDVARSAGDIIRKLGLQDRASVVRANLLDVDVGPADVVTLYLTTHSNEKLRPKLEKTLKAGARVVSHDYAMRGWKPARVEEVPFHNRVHKIYVYEMPPAK